jgi:hypothetical protein
MQARRPVPDPYLTARALPRSGFVPRPKMTMNAEVWWKTERPLSATLQQISTTSQN